jgi:surface antigen
MWPSCSVEVPSPGVADVAIIAPMGGVPLAVAWWAPLAIIGGALAGAVVGYLLLASGGADRSRDAESAERIGFERAESPTDLAWNRWAFVVVGGVVALVVGLSIGLSVD